MQLFGDNIEKFGVQGGEPFDVSCSYYLPAEVIVVLETFSRGFCRSSIARIELENYP